MQILRAINLHKNDIGVAMRLTFRIPGKNKTYKSAGEEVPLAPILMIYWFPSGRHAPCNDFNFSPGSVKRREAPGDNGFISED